MNRVPFLCSSTTLRARRFLSCSEISPNCCHLVNTKKRHHFSITSFLPHPLVLFFSLPLAFIKLSVIRAEEKPMEVPKLELEVLTSYSSGGRNVRAAHAAPNCVCGKRDGERKRQRRNILSSRRM